ncbi:hypothetical protein DFJ58DRAFT_669452 [Suillus subalutaceus]|uniref:uncharacterized protein n=1 Tax=Suillus subalutaceus TaxID=48586 RepID=UPI001B86F302|nr:uncharacterized protein DFJ58DRAFT_669452 [Suillus subalutaceus]KAG1836696.1 hypothetical protein DFJ58DRAFT_669452 [Suillus subalutaceus]
MSITFDPSEWLSCGRLFPQGCPPKIIQDEIKHLEAMPLWISISTPSPDLSVDTLLNLSINLAFDDIDKGSVLRFFSQQSALNDSELLKDFLSCPVSSFALSSELRQLFGQAWFDGCHSIIHAAFPTTPLPLWVLSYWYSMAQVMVARWESADNDGFIVVMEILNVLGCLPWDVRWKGFGAEGSVRSSELALLLADSKINGCLIDALIMSVVHKYMLSDPENCSRVAIKPLALSTALRCDASQWKEYATHNAFKCLRYIGDCLHDGTLQCVIFPINITNLHWAVFEVNASQQEILYGDSLDWTCPSADIDVMRCWLKQHSFKPFRKALGMPHGDQHDLYSCAVAALNTIHHAIFQDHCFLMM